MTYYYRYSGGMLRVISYNGTEIVLKDGEDTKVALVTKEGAGEPYFTWCGEMIFLDDWAKVKMESPFAAETDDMDIIPRKHNDIYDDNNIFESIAESQPPDKIVYLFVVSNNIQDSKYEIKEVENEEMETHTYKVYEVLNKDNTGMYRLRMVECDGKGNAYKDVYSAEFTKKLKSKEIKRVS